MTFIRDLANLPKNGILGRLPRTVFEVLRPALIPITMVERQVIYERDEPIERAYFVETGLISVVADAGNDDTRVEVGLIGSEGLAGVVAMFDSRPMAFARHIVQIKGSALAIPAAVLREAAQQQPELQQAGSLQVRNRLIQAAQAAVCNAHHALPARLARWLLNAQDRVPGQELPLTQEFLAYMLGTGRAAVTSAAGALNDAGWIRYRRGAVIVTDRAGLEGVACACYRQLLMRSGLGLGHANATQH